MYETRAVTPATEEELAEMREFFVGELDGVRTMAWSEAHSVYNTVTCSFEELQHQFNLLQNEFQLVIQKLRECARNCDLVDEEGGALDEFLQQFERY